MTLSTTARLPDLLDPATFRDHRPTEVFDRLADNGVERVRSAHADLDFWAVGGHDEVAALARDAQRLSSGLAGTILRSRAGQLTDSLTDLDAPRHTTLRRPMTRVFRASRLARLEPVVRDATATALAGLCDGGERVDLVATMRSIPAAVIGTLVGLPPSEWGRAADLGHLVNFVEDPAYAALIEHEQPSRGLAAYAHELAAHERRSPGDGLMAELLGSGTAEEPLTVGELESMIALLIAAATGTTIDSLITAVCLLADHPDVADLLSTADDATYRTAVEEVLRLATPVNYFARTAVVPLEIAGQQVDAGDRVALYFAAANVDRRVFSDPHTLDVTRWPNPHLSFGSGPHACLGAPLARLELHIMLEELCRHYVVLDVSSTRVESHINNAFSTASATIVRRPAATNDPAR